MCDTIETRILISNNDMKMVQKLEREVWQMDPLPIHQTITASQNGGLLIGAFINEELVGFSYGFAGFLKGKAYLCSHMLGIHPNYQEKGIGAKLKQEQKNIARAMGYELIVWTFDPLESRNAYLNISKLNAICSTYVENCYGEMEDALNQGLPSDRFKVEWWINSPHIEKKHSYDKKSALDLFGWEETEAGFPKLSDIQTGLDKISNSDEAILVPVPTNFQQLKSKQNELAIDWRYKTRTIFQILFAKGYAVVSLIKSENEPVHYYILVPRKSLDLPNQ